MYSVYAWNREGYLFKADLDGDRSRTYDSANRVRGQAMALGYTMALVVYSRQEPRKLSRVRLPGPRPPGPWSA